MSGYHNNSIFWVETGKISPNPFQPRREFEPKALEDLADSIRQYGVLQPLVVTRKEILLPDNDGMEVSYELIAGERRLRASIIAGLQQVPVIIRKETDNKVKLELAIIENLQREDLNPIDRAHAFEQLHREFNLTHVEIGKRMGKSRVYVSNTLRLLSLPEDIKQGLMEGRISEGHTRPLLMLTDRPQEQSTLYKEIMVKKLSVRDAEKVARKIAQDRVRKKEFIVDPKIREFEKKLSENLGTRVHIEPKENGGQITIDYFTVKDLEGIIASMKKVERDQSMMESFIAIQEEEKKQNLESSTSLSFSGFHPVVDDEEASILSKDTARNEFEEEEDFDLQDVTLEESSHQPEEPSRPSESTSSSTLKPTESSISDNFFPDEEEYSSLNISENFSYHAVQPRKELSPEPALQEETFQTSFDSHLGNEAQEDRDKQTVESFQEQTQLSGQQEERSLEETPSISSHQMSHHYSHPIESPARQHYESPDSPQGYESGNSYPQYEAYQRVETPKAKKGFFGKLFG